MKKLLCVCISVLLTTAFCFNAAYAEKYGNGKFSDTKTEQGDNGKTKDNVNDTAASNEVQNTDTAADAGSDAISIEALREQLKENHKDNDKRKELIKQIVELKRENNDNSIPVFVNGNDVKFDVPPVIKYGRVLIPVRAVTNALGAEVEWDETTHTATITKAVNGDENDAAAIVIVINMETGVVTVNGEEATLDVLPETIDNRTMVPLRFIAETFKMKVDWDDETGSATVEDEDSDTTGDEETTGDSTGDQTTTPAEDDSTGTTPADDTSGTTAPSDSDGSTTTTTPGDSTGTTSDSTSGTTAPTDTSGSTTPADDTTGAN